ncbi:MAG: tyrosine--tRNA ligase [Candidatus Thermoplasmatota archaeon]|nr:tyrosine--tRNA ligase [Candidatus Thermoplasmatota archaeon]
MSTDRDLVVKAMDEKQRLELVLDGAEEMVTEKELAELLRENAEPKAYVGYEPSGFVHIGWLIITKKIEKLIEAGFVVDILLADWHAFINDKFGGDLEKIKVCGEYFMDCYRAYGLGNQIEEGKLNFRWASEMANSADYWEKVLRIAKSASLSRIKRAMTVMGRKENEGDLDSSKFLYPSMQAADIFHLDVDLAVGGMDQRHAHMLARDAADKLGWKKPIALHTPMLSSLTRSGRMEMITGPTGGIDHDALARQIDSDLDVLVVNETLSGDTRNLLMGLKKMTSEKRHNALEVLIAGKRRVGGKTPIFAVINRGDNNGELAFDSDELKKMNKHLNIARKELFAYLGIEPDGEMSTKMSKSDPDSGIYLHDEEDDIRRKIKKAWCPEGVPDNPVMEICKTIIFPNKGELLITRPEKWGGNMHFKNYEGLRSSFARKQLHPADLKKEVANQMVEILKPFREYFKTSSKTLDAVKRYTKYIGR